MKTLAVLLVLLTMLGTTNTSLQFQDGRLQGVNENDFVINRAEGPVSFAMDENGDYVRVYPYIGEGGEYYVIGSLDIPEELKDYSEFLDTEDIYKQNFAYVVKDENGVFNSVVFMGCSINWEKLIDNVLPGGLFFYKTNVIYSEQFDLCSPVKGNAYHGVIQTHTEKDEEGYYYKYVYAYVETGAPNACVMIQNEYRCDSIEKFPSDAEVMERMKVYADMINGVS